MRVSHLSLLFLSELLLYLREQLVELSFLQLRLFSLFCTFPLSPFLVLFLCCALHRVDFGKHIVASQASIRPGIGFGDGVNSVQPLDVDVLVPYT